MPGHFAAGTGRQAQQRQDGKSGHRRKADKREMERLQRQRARLTAAEFKDISRNSVPAWTLYGG